MYMNVHCAHRFWFFFLDLCEKKETNNSQVTRYVNLLSSESVLHKYDMLFLKKKNKRSSLMIFILNRFHVESLFLPFSDVLAICMLILYIFVYFCFDLSRCLLCVADDARANDFPFFLFSTQFIFMQFRLSNK